jgi:hypothetical protein
LPIEREAARPPPRGVTIAPERMRTMRRRARLITTLAALGAVGMVGCQGGTGGYRRAAAKPEPSLAAADEGGSGFVVSKPPPPEVGVVDRHPLFSKPREVYNNAGNNKIVKVAGATIVGVPMGIAGEIRQIIVGVPATSPPAF